MHAFLRVSTSGRNLAIKHLGLSLILTLSPLITQCAYSVHHVNQCDITEEQEIQDNTGLNVQWADTG